MEKVVAIMSRLLDQILEVILLEISGKTKVFVPPDKIIILPIAGVFLHLETVCLQEAIVPPLEVVGLQVLQAVQVEERLVQAAQEEDSKNV